MDRNKLYRSIPKVDTLLEAEEIRELAGTYGHDVVMSVIHEETDKLRQKIRESDDEEAVSGGISQLPSMIAQNIRKLFEPDMKRVINATGTILHTNLGRAPLGREHFREMEDIVCGYSNLEYDLEAGRRGMRYDHIEKLLCRLTGAEAAMAVNNNAAAVLLILNTLADGGEIIISRGELVEIGGQFRMPDVIRMSGAELVEVGTTNKTHLSDYERAVTEETRVLLKVHPSNYRVMGFAESVDTAQLAALSEEKGIPIVEDLGSGFLADLSEYRGMENVSALNDEPSVRETLEAGADIVCFSGDKLLGGPQAGIIAGRGKYIEQMKRNPLTRALRIDKFTVAALEIVLREYLYGEKTFSRIPVLRMISEQPASLRAKAESLAEILRQSCFCAGISVKDCESQIGGGSLPMERLPGAAVVIRPVKISAAALEEMMRHFQVPVIARVTDDAVWLDVRTISAEDFEIIGEMFGGVLS